MTIEEAVKKCRNIVDCLENLISIIESENKSNIHDIKNTKNTNISLLKLKFAKIS